MNNLIIKNSLGLFILLLAFLLGFSVANAQKQDESEGVCGREFHYHKFNHLITMKDTVIFALDSFYCRPHPKITDTACFKNLSKYNKEDDTVKKIKGDLDPVLLNQQYLQAQILKPEGFCSNMHYQCHIKDTVYYTPLMNDGNKEKQKEDSFDFSDLANLIPCTTYNDRIKTLPLKVFPNPASSSINIETIETNSPTQIFSLNGQLLKEITQKELKEEIDITNLSKGIYIIKTGNKMIRFVKE